MIIILEGENKCGKTTLAKYIVEKYGFEYIKCSQPGEEGPFAEYSKIIDKISQESKNYVIDRMYIGEFVYGPIYRNVCALTQEQFENIENRLKKLNAVLIYCYDTVENIAKRFDEDGEEFASKDNIRKILDKYTEVLEKTILPKHEHKMKSDNDLIKNNKINTIIKKSLKIE